MTSTTESKTDRIRALNDAFRRTFVGGAVMITAGVEAMPLDQRRSWLQKVRSFEAFGEDNDPHGEHDFGAVDEVGARCFWKIDYYDRKTKFGSPDAADPAVTTRVLTCSRNLASKGARHIPAGTVSSQSPLATSTAPVAACATCSF